MTPVRKALSEIRRSTLGVFRPAEQLPLSEWIERNIWLPSGLSAVPGPIALWKFQRELADAMIDPNIEKITVLKGSRLGYTSLLVGAIAHFIKNDPASILVVVPTDDDVRNFVVGQLESTFEASPTLKNVLPNPHSGGKDRDTLKYRRGAGWSFRCVSARSPRNLRAHAARIVITDETDAFEVTVEGEAVALASKRSLTFPNRKLINGSSPTTESGSYVAAAFEQSDMRVFECRCQQCGDYHELKWAQIQWPEGKPREACWICDSCGGVHTDEQKPAMVAQGRWRALAPHVKGHAGFRLNCLIAPFAPASWGRLAEEFVQAKRKPETLRVFVNTILAETWREEDDGGPQPHELQSLAEPMSLADIPEEVIYLASGADIQGDRIELSTWGFTEDDEWLVLDHRQLFGDPLRDDAVWSDLADVLRERHPHPLGGTIGRDATCVDASDGNTTNRVLSFCAGHRHLRCIPIKGASGSRPPLTPTASKRSRALMIAGIDPLKSRLYDRLAKRTGIRFSDALPLAYYEQLTAERPVVRYARGQPTRIWERYAGRLAEALDCAIYTLAARSAVAVNPARRGAELASRIGLPPATPQIIRSTWMDNGRRILTI
jgi:phage terminase large subunit GpA-like protein